MANTPLINASAAANGPRTGQHGQAAEAERAGQLTTPFLQTDEIQSRLTRLQADYAHAIRTVRSERKALAAATQREQTALQAQQLIQAVAEAIQQKAHSRIAGIVSRCLKAVFGPDAYSFEVGFRQARGKTEAQLRFLRDGRKVDPSNVGGGVLDVTAFALRLLSLMLSRPRKRRILFLDEPFRHLSREHRPAARQLLESLADEMATQIVLITHSKQIACGKVIHL